MHLTGVQVVFHPTESDYTVSSAAAAQRSPIKLDIRRHHQTGQTTQWAKALAT
jgi:NADPH-dependent ferric siderophore reductase